VATEHLGDDEDEVGSRRSARQLACQAHADDMRHRLVQRLAEKDGLRLDAADAVAQDTERVDHRRMGVGSDERVGEGHAVALVDDRSQELEIDLVDDAGPRRDDAQVAERRLGPTQQLVALAVPLVLALDVERERITGAEAIDLDGVVDDEVGRHERVDPGRIAAQVGHRVPHHGEIDDRRHAGEVLHDHPRRHERDLSLRSDPRPPRRERLDVSSVDHSTGVTEQVLEQDPDRDGQTRFGGQALDGP
jgi:hypothetical protein